VYNLLCCVLFRAVPRRTCVYVKLLELEDEEGREEEGEF
jgi:hypothetical protein